MNKKEISIGTKFNKWTVIEQLDDRKNGYIIYRVKCSCGYIGEFNGTYLRSEKSKYCRSCSSKKRVPKGKKNKFYRHGSAMYSSPLRPTYSIWLMMKQRCQNPKNRHFYNYGARGIKVCDNWQSFEGFFKDMGKKPEGLSLERIDNDGNYCKENCKWATRLEQNNNRRDNTTFIIEGKKVTRTQIQNKLGWTRSMYRRRCEKYGSDWIVEQYKLSL
jgi:hypothetical protein